MAGKCKEMNKIKQALGLHLDGESNRSIGRKLDLYKGTVIAAEWMYHPYHFEMYQS